MPIASRPAPVHKTPSHEFVITALLLGLGCLALLTGLPGPINVYDEGITVHGAQRVLEVDRPYSGFWTLYAPGQFYIVAGLFKLFGPSILVERLWDTMVRTGLFVLAFLLTRKLAPTGIALTVGAFTALWLAHIGHFGYPVFPALFLILLGFLLLVHASSHRRHAPWSIAAGLAVGMATWIRHDLGVYALVSVVIAVWLVRRISLPTPGDDAGRLPPGILAFFLLGAGVVLMPAVVFLVAGTGDDTVLDLLIAPATIFPSVRSLPFPPAVPTLPSPFSGPLPPSDYLRRILDGLAFYLPLVTYAACLLAITCRLLRRHAAVDNPLLFILLPLFGIISLNQARIRSDLIHLPPTFIPAIVLTAVWSRSLLRVPGGIRGAVLSGIVLGAWALLLIQPVHGFVMQATRFMTPRAPAMQFVARARGIQLDPDQARAVAFIQHHVPPDGLIFVGNDRHDRLVINDVAFCFLAERGSATRYHELHPGIATTAPVQREIIADLERKDVRYVVRVSRLGNPNEPNESSRSSGVRILDEYLGAKFQPVEEFGNYSILRRR